MNKAQFIEALAARLGSDKKAAGTALDAVLDEIYTVVVKGEKLALTGFGSFEKRDRSARVARNPATGASVRVKKTSVPAFRAGAEFKAVISGAKKLAKQPAKKAAATKAAASSASASSGPASRTSASSAPAAAAKAPARRAAKSSAASVGRAAKATGATATKSTPAKSATPAKKAATKRGPARRTS